MATLESVGRRPHADSHRDGIIVRLGHITGPQPNDPVAEILGSSPWRYIAQADEKVGVLPG